MRLPYKVNIVSFFFILLRKAPKKIFKGAFCFYTLKKETIARNAENEVVKKASSLTANGDPR